VLEILVAAASDTGHSQKNIPSAAPEITNRDGKHCDKRAFTYVIFSHEKDTTAPHSLWSSLSPDGGFVDRTVLCVVAAPGRSAIGY